MSGATKHWPSVVSDMTMQSQLVTLLQGQRFDEARTLLQKHLASGELFDPRTDRQWAPIADGIAAIVSDVSGPDATIPFWEALLDFFTNSIEPVWGHAHKGHIYFRLANAVARHDLARTISLFQAAYQEDILLETASGDSHEEIMQRSQHYSAYVALAILERITDGDFATPHDKALFYDNLFGPSFDAAMTGDTVRPELVQDALAAIVPPQAFAACQSLYEELHKAATLAMPFATVSLTGTVLESLLLGKMHYGMGMTTLSNGRSILHVELGPLLQAAMHQGVFPTSAIQAAAQLVHIFRNRLHPGNESRQTYTLTPRVSNTLKVFFELALLEWRQALP
jgi:hypothetical protein